MPTFAPGSLQTALVTITGIPAGLPCQVEVFLSPNTSTKIATSGKISFTSTISPQVVPAPITMPSATGSYNVLSDLYIAGVLVHADLFTAVTVASGTFDLQSAILTAAAGSVLNVPPGYYKGALLLWKRLTLQSSTGKASDVIIDAQGGDKNSTYLGNGCMDGGGLRLTAPVTLNRLTVRNSYYNNIDCAPGSDGSVIYQCDLLDWGIQPSGHTDGTQCSAVQLLAHGITVKGCYINRGINSNAHAFIANFGGMNTNNYSKNYQNWCAITAFDRSQGGHLIQGNYVDGGYLDYYSVNVTSDGAQSYTPSATQHYVPGIHDGLCSDQWLGGSRCWNNSTLGSNVVVGCWDDNIDFQNIQGVNVTVTSNFVDGMRYSRSCVVIGEISVGPIYIGLAGKGNVFKNWNLGNTAIKNGSYVSGDSDGAKYVQYNTLWSDLSHWINMDTNGTSANNNFSNNKYYTIDGTAKLASVSSDPGSIAAKYTAIPEPPTP